MSHSSKKKEWQLKCCQVFFSYLIYYLPYFMSMIDWGATKLALIQPQSHPIRHPNNYGKLWKKEISFLFANPFTRQVLVKQCLFWFKQDRHLNQLFLISLLSSIWFNQRYLLNPKFVDYWCQVCKPHIFCNFQIRKMLERCLLNFKNFNIKRIAVKVVFQGNQWQHCPVFRDEMGISNIFI